MRWLRRIALGVAALVLLAAAVIYGGSQWIIGRDRGVPQAKLDIPHDAASIAEGGRIATTMACRDCHGPNGEGKVLFDQPMVGRIAPPPLAAVAARMTDEELVRAIRHGVHKDGSALFIMPVNAYAHIADDDLARIVAWIRTLRPQPGPEPRGMHYGPVGRALILAGAFPPKTVAEKLAPATRPAELGRYYFDSVCSSCHKLAEDGLMEDGKEKVPALAPIAAAYDPAAFRRLLRTGVAANGKTDIGMMSMVSRNAFHALTDDEIAAIHAWLTAEAARLPRQ